VILSAPPQGVILRETDNCISGWYLCFTEPTVLCFFHLPLKELSRERQIISSLIGILVSQEQCLVFLSAPPQRVVLGETDNCISEWYPCFTEPTVSVFLSASLKNLSLER